MPLTDIAVRNAKPNGKAEVRLLDGGGLYLIVTPSGTKVWRLHYREDGMSRTRALGKYPEMTLGAARKARDRLKGADKSTSDPESDPGTKPVVRAGATPFRVAAFAWFEARKGGWSAPYAERIWARVEGDLVAPLGNLPLGELEPAKCLTAIQAIEKRGAIEMAKRVKNYLSDILEFAIASGWTSDNPARNIGRALATRPPVAHRAALKAKDLPDFFGRLDRFDGDDVTKEAIRLVLYAFPRTQEVRFATRDQFELQGAEPVWRVPAENMKMGAPHIVPLAPQVVEIVKRALVLAGPSRYLFPRISGRSVIDEPISNNTMLTALYRMGYAGRATIHGFRSTASTILNENGFSSDWIERQLDHIERDQVRAAYNTAQWLPQRREMMVWWANYLDDKAAIGAFL